MVRRDTLESHEMFAMNFKRSFSLFNPLVRFLALQEGKLLAIADEDGAVQLLDLRNSDRNLLGTFLFFDGRG